MKPPRSASRTFLVVHQPMIGRVSRSRVRHNYCSTARAPVYLFDGEDKPNPELPPIEYPGPTSMSPDSTRESTTAWLA